MQEEEFFTDSQRICVDCKRPFTWTSGEQLYYRSKSLSAPKRCKSCREARRRNLNPDPEARS